MSNNCENHSSITYTGSVTITFSEPLEHHYAHGACHTPLWEYCCTCKRTYCIGCEGKHNSGQTPCPYVPYYPSSPWYPNYPYYPTYPIIWNDVTATTDSTSASNAYVIFTT